MKKQKETTPTPKTDTLMSGPAFKPFDLHKALMDLEDLMESLLCPFILTGETAKCVKEGTEIKTDKITAVVKSPEVTKFRLGMFRTKGEVTEDGLKYTVGEIPIEVKFLSKKFNFLERPDTKIYKAGIYSLPNPWENYWKARFLVTNKTK